MAEPVDFDPLASLNDINIDKHYDSVENTNQTDDNSNIGLTYQTNKLVNYTPEGKVQIPITKSGAFIKFALFDEHTRVSIVRKIENYFTLRTIQITGAWKQSKRCKIDNEKQRIIVPRFGIYEILNNKFGLLNHSTVCQITPGDDCKFTWNAQLNENQQVIQKYMMDNIYNINRANLGSAGCILNLAAGQGKSYLAAYLMSKFNKKTAIVVHSTSMIEQWNKVLKTCYPELSVGFYYGKAKVLGDVMLLVIDSAIKPKFVFKKQNKEMTALEFYSMFGFIIYDECHLYANNNDGQVFKVAQARYVLGLSATPDENANKFDKIHQWELGSVLQASKIPGYKSIANNFTANIYKVQYYAHPDYAKNIIEPATGMLSTSKMLSQLTTDMKRASLVVDCICKCLEANLYTYVFADRRDYLELLRCMLSARQKNVDSDIVVSDGDFMRLVGGSKALDLETAEVKSKCIFTTFAYGATGRSIIKMNGLVLATPRKSGMTQTIGRILRLGSDASIKRQIYDIVDMKIKLKSQWSSRKKYYDSMGFEIVEEKYEHDKIPDPNLNLPVAQPNIPLDTTILDEKPSIIEKNKDKPKKKSNTIKPQKSEISKELPNKPAKSESPSKPAKSESPSKPAKSKSPTSPADSESPNKSVKPAKRPNVVKSS